MLKADQLCPLAFSHSLASLQTITFQVRNGSPGVVMPLIKKSDVQRHFASKLSARRAAGAEGEKHLPVERSHEVVPSNEFGTVPTVIEMVPTSASRAAK